MLIFYVLRSRNQTAQSEIVIDKDRMHASRKERRFPKVQIPDAKAVAFSARKGVSQGVSAVSSLMGSFKEFLNRGNVFDLAVGVVMGAAFTSVVNSMVKDIFTPIISLGLDQVSLDNSFLVLACPKNLLSNNNRPARKTCSSNFTTILQAQTAGAITWNYGVFLSNIMTFLITSVIIYFVVKAYCATFRRQKPEETEKDCPFCCKKIPIKATRCAFCTSTALDEQDEQDSD